jgi:hypothetical protein
MQALQSLSTARRLALAAIFASVCAATSACAVKRELVITSEPPGALVRLDDTVVGTTPFSTRFEAYGSRRITLYHPGYRTISSVEDIEPPWYGRFPFDVFSEVLFPVGWRDRHERSYTLVPESGTLTRPDLDAVLKRAQALRLAEPTGPRPDLSDLPAEPKKAQAPD